RVVDSDDRDVCVIECTSVAVRRLSEIDDQFAKDEGEGFNGASDWRAAHEAFWSGDEHVRELGIELTDDTLVVAERFSVVD
ncbi:MAG: ASCH domain-containing protein, partial [Solirubrobacteraceae bacterium]|nr:ASCH domain-containing protein [Solirubrobacteraceae bacterium]